MNVNEQIIRPLLGFASTVALFLIPMITMRLFAEEKKTGTIELLLTSPVNDIEIILGKWLGALLLYLCVLGMSMINIALLFAWGKPDLEAGAGGLPRADPARRLPAGHRDLHLHHHQEPDHRRRRHLLRLPAALAAELVHGLRHHRLVAGGQLPSIVTHFENFGKGVLDSKDVVFYLSMIFFSLFMTSRSMESLRWRA